MDRVFFGLGSILALLAVGAGAFGAHALRSRLSPDMLTTFEVGARYHMYHALGLLAVAWAATRWPGGAVTAAGWLFLVGIVLFSGSLYLLSLTGQRWLGAITPLGGAAFLVGWFLLLWTAWKAP
jgi:uncharacterized membrane protein YgdD (TMEM256/DUF423 family)